jgi:TIGR02436 family protein
MAEGILKTKSYEFDVRIVKLSQNLQSKRKEFSLSKQLLRSGTAIGALIREAEYGQSKIDFIRKLSISLKEANETNYWLSLLKDTDYLENKLFISIETDCIELIKLLTASIKTAKNSIQ